MPDRIPNGITRNQILLAIHDFESGVYHGFGESTGYDLLHDGKRMPPKAIIGLAAAYVLGYPLGPYDFKGGQGTKCFKVLESNGFEITTKNHNGKMSTRTGENQAHEEGKTIEVRLTRYERNREARKACIDYYGARCQICQIDFGVKYPGIGEGFIHVHHINPLSKTRSHHTVNPIRDLFPVCPNCHWMLHQKIPSYSIEEMKLIVQSV